MTFYTYTYVYAYAYTYTILEMAIKLAYIAENESVFPGNSESC